MSVKIAEAESKFKPGWFEDPKKTIARF